MKKIAMLKFTVLTVVYLAISLASGKDVDSIVHEIQEAEIEEADKNRTSDVPTSQINQFLSSSPYIKAIGYNSITQLYKIKEYKKKLNLSGHELFEALMTDYAKAHGSFLKRCKPTDDIYSDDELPIPKEFDCCPFPNIKCRKTTLTYRSIDGSCNCKKNSHMGRSNRAYSRFLYPDYEDGISAPRAAKSGEPLPSARLLSTAIFKARGKDKKSEILTVMHMTLGQFLDHDCDRTPISKFQKSTGHIMMSSFVARGNQFIQLVKVLYCKLLTNGKKIPTFSHMVQGLDCRPQRWETRVLVCRGELTDIQCGKSNCKTEGATKRECYPIIIPEDEEVLLETPCLKFVRSQAFMADGCKIGPREQANVVTSWIDCSFLYGSSVQELEKIRDKDKSRGRMAEIKHPMNDKCKPLAPTQSDAACEGLKKPMKCFLTGDSRQNEQVGIISMHIILIRLHNYFEEELYQVNPKWDGEKLFQETRKLVIAVWQNIVYSEYIPPLLGNKEITKYNLKMSKTCFTGYNCMNFSGDISNVFATVAFRFGHSQITEDIMLKASMGKGRKMIPYQSVLFRPQTIYETHFGNTTCGVDAILLGHTRQRTDQSDEFFPDSMRNHLFSPSPPQAPGTDLAAMDIQRGRDHGIAGYNAWRKWCGLPVAQTFNDLIDIPKYLRQKFEDIYEHVDDIDLFVGGMVEHHVIGGIVGRTFACILGRQFQNVKFADRFWFERCQQRTGYTPRQIKNIKQYTSGRLLCETLDHVTSVQRFTMMKPRKTAEKRFSDNPEELAQVLKLYGGHENKPEPCANHPGIDFSLFKS